MEIRRLKNIAIVLLALLNLALLALLGYQRSQARRTAAETVSALHCLFTAEHVTLSEETDPLQSPLSLLTLARNAAGEENIASFLLGEEAASSSQGGGIYCYAAPAGQILFRAGGSFSGRLSRPCQDAAAFVQEFCQKFGYQDLSVQSSGEAQVFSAVQYLSGVPVEGCALTLRFEDGALVYADGTHVSLEGAVVEPEERLSCATALIRFLDYRRISGAVCSRVEEVQCIYNLKNTAPTLQLIPVWRIEADTCPYFVDCITGNVFRG